MKNRLGAMILSAILVLVLSSDVQASESKDANDLESATIQILVENGYTKETAEALPKAEQEELMKILTINPTKVDISTTILEIDTLSEIESFFSCSDEELINMGADEKQIKTTRNLLEEMDSMSDKELSDKLDISKTEAKMFHKAVNKGKSNAKSGNYKGKKRGVTASGSISASEMIYTQSVTNNSTSKKPNYKVNIAYTWKQVYAMACFNDAIVAAWGGGLNTKTISSTANYYNWEQIGGSFGSLYVGQAMKKTETPQAGITFKFKQSVPRSGYYGPKTKKGYVQFTLYQTKKHGYDTKVVSYYCHRVISASSASISISASGPSVSVSIGSAYDKTSQRSATIQY